MCEQSYRYARRRITSSKYEELQKPSFAEYHICFSSRDDRGMGGFVRRPAVADQFGWAEGKRVPENRVAISLEMFSGSRTGPERDERLRARTAPAKRHTGVR